VCKVPTVCRPPPARGCYRLASRFRFVARLALAALLPASTALALDPGQPFGDFVRDHWGIREGLPQVSVLSIEQDAGGYIWVGTQNGIARFDGLRFTAFDRRNDTGHVAAMVRDISRDRLGRLWFAHARGVLRHDGQDFNAFETRPTALAANAVAEAPDGRILVATATGLHEARDGALLPAGAAGEDLGAIAFDADGTLWLGADGAVLEQYDGGFRRHPLPVEKAGPVVALALEGDTLWAGTRVGLFAIDTTTGAIRVEDPLAGVAVESLLLDRGGTLWIGSRAALHRRLPDGRLLHHGDDEFVPQAWVTGLFEDRDGHLWVGSQNDSLFRLSDGWIARFGAAQGLRDTLAWSLAQAPDGSVTVGTNSGIERFADGRFEPLLDGRLLPDPTAYELAWDVRGRLWIGTRAGLARLDAPGGTPVAIDAVGTPQVNAIVPGVDDAWVGTADGVFRWRAGSWRRAGPGGPAPERRVRGILPLDGERALLATEGGVRLLDGDATSIPAWAAPLEGSIVTAIDRVQPDLIIVSTLDRGFGVLLDERLAMVEREGELATLSAWGARLVRERVYVSAAEGVISVPIEDLREFWRSPDARLDWRVPASIAGTLRGSQRARCCNGGARSRLLDDGARLWLPTLEGPIALDVERIDRAGETPIVHIEQARHAGRLLPLPASGEAVRLDGEARDLVVGFTAIAHRDPRGLRFAYRLDGFDADWVQAGERREAFYTNLPPGRFIFRVRAESSARVTSEGDRAIAFEVPPRWHERTGNRVGIAALLGLLLAMLARNMLRWREHAHARREQSLQAEVAARTADLADANDRLRAANRALAQESETDLLTGLRNRRWLLNHLGEWLREAPPAADGGAACALFALFDLDRFKDLNARFGQGGGDALLRQFASLLQKLAGADAVVTRWGGEEFLLVQRGLSRNAARTRVQAIWRAVQEHLHPAPDGTPILLPCSVGYALYPPSAQGGGVPWSVSVELADAATLRVRRQARNSWAGLVVADDADPALLAGGTVGRLDALLEAGVLAWDHPGAG
jgi:diguanylate cyclase (GGDEF)-like protein